MEHKECKHELVVSHIQIVIEVINSVINRLVELIKPIVDVITEVAISYMANIYLDWWHYYKHAKRCRIRKKYRDKLLREMFALMSATRVTEVERR